MGTPHSLGISMSPMTLLPKHRPRSLLALRLRLPKRPAAAGKQWDYQEMQRYGGFHNCGYPIMDCQKGGNPKQKWMIAWGTPIFGNHRIWRDPIQIHFLEEKIEIFLRDFVRWLIPLETMPNLTMQSHTHTHTHVYIYIYINAQINICHMCT